MFGLKKDPNNLQQKIEGPKHEIGVIPDIFYGGNDPDIYNEKMKEKKDFIQDKKLMVSEEKKQNMSVSSVTPRRAPPPPPLPLVDQNTILPSQQNTTNSLQSPVVASSKSKKFWIIIVIFVFFIIIFSIVWFFFLKNSNSSDTPKIPVSTENEDSPIFLPPFEPILSTTTEVQENFETLEQDVSSTLFVPPIQKDRSLPALSLIDPVDTDNDSLSNSEEEIFGTDPEILDSDADGYYDGQEVFNLYNPKGFAPMKIIDSGLVQEYSNPTWKYRLYYPVSWVATAIDARDNNDILLSAITGDYIHIKSSEKLSGESFPGWFGRVVGDQLYTDIVLTKNRFSVPFYRRKDGLVTYFEAGNRVFMVILYSRDENKNDIPHIMDMVSQSFRVGREISELPPQLVLPTPGMVTSTTEFIASSTVR